MDFPGEFDSYAVVVLRRPEGIPDLPSEEEERLQEEHQAHIMSLMQSGAAYAGGPLLDASNPALVGLMIFRAPLDEARGLANEDPKVRAGRLVADSFTWWFPAGMLDFDRASGDGY
jgi:uncharacterized protein YciI